MIAMTSTGRSVCVTIYPSTVIIATVSYQCGCYLQYSETHLHGFICWYCTLIYDKYLIFVMFYIKLSQIFDFIKILNMSFCNIFEHNVFLQTKKSTIFQFLIIDIVVLPLKDGALSVVRTLRWGILWLRYKSPCFS